MPLGRFRAVPEPPGAQHRCQGQRHHTGEHHRRRQGKAEFGEQPADVAPHERDRNKHRHKRQCGGNDRKSDLFCAPVSGKQRRLTLIDPALDVLQHHDGIVDHQANGKNHCQQGENVDGKPEKAQTNKRTNNRDRNGHCRNQGGPPGAQEQENNQDNQGNGDGERGDHLLYGGPDKNGFIVAFGNGHFRRQDFPDLLKLGPNGIGYRYGIGLGLADNAHADGGLAVGAQAADIGLDTHLNIRHLTQAQQIVAIPANHKLPELLNVRQTPLGPNRKITGGGIHRTGWQLNVIGSQRPLHLRHGDIAGSQSLLVKPDPDGIPAFTANADIGDAVENRQPVCQNAVGKITQLGTVPDITAQGDPHHRSGVGICLLHHRGIRFIR